MKKISALKTVCQEFPLAALRETGDHIDRVILASAEGLDQTIKLPVRADAYLDRLQAAVDTQPAAKVAYPDVKAMMRRVHVRLDAAPIPIQFKIDGGATIDFLLQRRDLQTLAGTLIADPDTVVALLRIYRALDRGMVPSLAGIPSRLLPDYFLSGGGPITLGAMSTLMDVSSGVGTERKAQVARQARSTVLGDWLDFTQHYDGIAPELDLGDDYRAMPSSHVPVLLFSGTLDGRTDIESQREAVAGLHNLTHIVIENSGHNPRFTPEILAATDRFMLGQPAMQTRLHVDPPNFVP